MITAIVRALSWVLSLYSIDPRWNRLGGTQVIIDWHNYGFTIMQVNNVNAKLVTMARAYELWFGKFGDWHLTVSEAMKKNLAIIAPAVGLKPI